MEVLLDFEKKIAEFEQEIESIRNNNRLDDEDKAPVIKKLEEKLRGEMEKTFGNLSRWQKVQLARHPRRPYSLDYINRWDTTFYELNGDRGFRNDRAIVSGLCKIDGINVMVIAQQKGRGTKENLLRNFGMAHPEGYRKALRLMKVADRFGIPVVTLLDTPGAYPGIGAEERGQAESIARNLFDMVNLKTPTLTCIIGEGGSGGALALAVTDRVVMMEYAVYSVISPEGCAAILYRDASQAERAAENLKITATDLKKLGIIDEIVPEPLGGAHRDFDAAAKSLETVIGRNLRELMAIPTPDWREMRVEKYSKMGVFTVD
ncbi:MAG: acetyl-CoA carboxylase carboxyltransferase subunit alpha [bacterium]|nr:acetyl-CoA carboxylase carboxyltransferase subunit alpha [bacterium]